MFILRINVLPAFRMHLTEISLVPLATICPPDMSCINVFFGTRKLILTSGSPSACYTLNTTAFLNGYPVRSDTVRLQPPTQISIVQGVYVRKFNSSSLTMHAVCI